LSELPDYALVNRETWTKANAKYTDANAERSWSRDITWGMWSVPEEDVHALPDVAGKDVIELGCGTAYFSAYLARLGARVVGVDVTPAQLETARRMQKRFGLEFPLIEANAEEVPLPDASFDLVHSEYGASIWCDPYKWIPEAARLLRPGGHLVFLRNSTLAVLCATVEGPPSETLQRPQLGLHKLEWTEPDPEIEFQLGHGDWIRLLRANGFEIEDLIELFAPSDAVDHGYYASNAEWAKKWPSEAIWRARLVPLAAEPGSADA
jgi:ubiquinone/menaquinone biosynthesis C-methylase UbiE